MTQFVKPSDKLRETLKAWLKMTPQQNWQTIVKALRSRIIDELTLASIIEEKYCQGTPGEAGRQALPRDTQIEALQQQFEQKLREKQHAAIDRKQKFKKQLQSMKQPSARPQPNPPQHEMTHKKLIWRDGPKAPEAMERGSVATDGTTVYFNDRSSPRVHQYHSDYQQWSTLPDLPHTRSTLVMADSKLTSVGGYRKQYLRSDRATNSVLSLTQGRLRGMKWSQHFPAMFYKRYFTAVVCHGRSLIVAGGHNGDYEVAKVEVLDMDIGLWSSATSLPHSFSEGTTSICGERLYLLGGSDQTPLIRSPHLTRYGTHSVFTCSISELLHSCGKEQWE